MVGKSRVLMVVWCVLAGSLVLRAQPEFLKPQNFLGERIPATLTGEPGEFLPDAEGRIWIFRALESGFALWRVEPDGQLTGPMGTRVFHKPLLAYDAAKSRVLCLTRSEDDAESSLLFELHVHAGLARLGTLKSDPPLAWAVDSGGDVWTVVEDGDRSKVVFHDGPLPAGEVEGEVRVSLPFKAKGLLAHKDKHLLAWDEDEVWRIPTKGGKPRQVFLAPSEDARETKIRSLVSSPFDAPGEGVIVITSEFDHAGKYLASSAYFGPGARIPTTPFITKLGFPIIQDGFTFERVRAGERGALHFLSRAPKGAAKTLRFDRVTQRVRSKLPGSLEASVKGRRVEVRLQARPGKGAPVKLLLSVRAPTGGKVDHHLVDIDPGGHHTRVLRDGMAAGGGEKAARTDEKGRYITTFELPRTMLPGTLFYLQAIVTDDLAANTEFLVSNVTTLTVPLPSSHARTAGDDAQRIVSVPWRRDG